jgi:hypothetical protein
VASSLILPIGSLQNFDDRKSFLLRFAISEALSAVGSQLGSSFQPGPDSIHITTVANATSEDGSHSNEKHSPGKLRVGFTIRLSAAQSSTAAINQMGLPEFAKALAGSVVKHGVLPLGTALAASDLQLAPPVAQAAAKATTARGNGAPGTGAAGEGNGAAGGGAGGKSGVALGLWVAPIVLSVGVLVVSVGVGFVKRYQLGANAQTGVKIASAAGPAANVIKDPDFDDDGDDEWHDEASERTSLVKGKGRSKQQGENVL